MKPIDTEELELALLLENGEYKLQPEVRQNIKIALELAIKELKDGSV